jgi:selenocysteine lyase/cysteine desulfurase
VGLDERTAHLCAGGEAPMLRAGAGALAEFCRLKSGGMAGRQRVIDVYDETKALLASFLGASPLDLAFLAHASDGMNVLARGLDLLPGDSVISLANEYPSSLLPWLARGVELKAVPPGDDPEAAIAAAAGERTRVIAVSHVSYLTGLRLDLERLRDVARSCGAVLAVDASHSLGVLPVPLATCDVLVSCCYKFLLATHGVGVFYWNRERLPELGQPSVGWHSVEWPTVEERSRGYTLKPGAARFELGNPSFVSLFVLREALRVLATLDAARIEAHILGLGGELRDGLAGLGLQLLTPADPRRRGPNVVVATPDDDRFTERLAERGALAWSGDGRVRFSLHAYNDGEDVARALSAVAELV